MRRPPGDERGFTLVEVLIATALFVVVAVAGFETLHGLGAIATLVTQRTSSASALDTTLATLRSRALSAAAVWIPNASCGVPAVSMMLISSTGTSFETVVFRGNALVRADAPGPIDPCDAAVAFDTILTNIEAVTVTPVGPATLAALPDGALFTASLPVVSIDSHRRDVDGTPIRYGNSAVELTIDADPFASTVELAPGNAPSGYTVALTYACGARCQANGSTAQSPFPELRGLDERTCTIDGPSLPNTSAYYVPAAFGVNGAGQIVVTQYAVQLRYGYTFAGSGAPLDVARVGPVFTWPATASLADPYPVDYTTNAVIANLAAIEAGAPPSGLATLDATCTAMNAEHDFG